MLHRSHVLEHMRGRLPIDPQIEITESLIRRACEQPTLDDALDEIRACMMLFFNAEAGHA